MVCVYPRLPMTYLPEWHKQFGAAVMLGAVSFWAFICRSDPGIITAETVGQFLGRPGYYEPDGRIYQPGTQCRTTGLPRPARSKFCAISEVNVARYLVIICYVCYCSSYLIQEVLNSITHNILIRNVPSIIYFVS